MCLQRLQGFAANTWKQYWPKLSNMVRWLRANQPSTGQTFLISESTFMAYMDDLNSGIFKDSGSGDALTCVSLVSSEVN